MRYLRRSARAFPQLRQMGLGAQQRTAFCDSADPAADEKPIHGVRHR